MTLFLFSLGGCGEMFSFSSLFLSTYFRRPICDKPLELAYMYLPYLVTVAKECPLELEKRF